MQVRTHSQYGGEQMECKRRASKYTYNGTLFHEGKEGPTSVAKYILLAFEWWSVVRNLSGFLRQPNVSLFTVSGLNLAHISHQNSKLPSLKWFGSRSHLAVFHTLWKDPKSPLQKYTCKVTRNRRKFLHNCNIPLSINQSLFSVIRHVKFCLFRAHAVLSLS